MKGGQKMRVVLFVLIDELKNNKDMDSKEAGKGAQKVQKSNNDNHS